MTQNNQRSDFGYLGDVGAFPPNLQALYQNPGGYATWSGPYLPPTFAQDSTGFKTDEWGALYSYSGGTVLTSLGSGSAISRKIADASGDYLLNSINGTILDAANDPPGAALADSINIVISYPNGSGSTTSKTYNPDAMGSFTLDSIPVGSHLLRVIYTPTVDTLTRYLTVLPRHKGRPSYRFASAYFTSGGGSACDSAGTMILRPMGPGAVTELDQTGCGANWECVSEVTADDNASRVTRLNGAYRTDTYATEDATDSSCTITRVRVYSRGEKATATMNGYLKIVIRAGGTNYESAAFDLTNTWTDFYQEWTQNPATGLAWTWADVNALEIGVSLRSISPFFESKCTQVWVEVDYIP
jgi:hypothetical protein